MGEERFQETSHAATECPAPGRSDPRPARSHAGLPRLREEWIRARGDVVETGRHALPAFARDGRHGNADESSVYTRFDSPFRIGALLPPGARVIDARGVRIATPAARVMRVPGLRQVFRTAERALCDSPLRVFGGFYIAASRRGT